MQGSTATFGLPTPEDAPLTAMLRVGGTGQTGYGALTLRNLQYGQEEAVTRAPAVSSAQINANAPIASANCYLVQ